MGIFLCFLDFSFNADVSQVAKTFSLQYAHTHTHTHIQASRKQRLVCRSKVNQNLTAWDWNTLSVRCVFQFHLGSCGAYLVFAAAASTRQETLNSSPHFSGSPGTTASEAGAVSLNPPHTITDDGRLWWRMPSWKFLSNSFWVSPNWKLLQNKKGRTSGTPGNQWEEA